MPPTFGGKSLVTSRWVTGSDPRSCATQTCRAAQRACSTSIGSSAAAQCRSARTCRRVGAVTDVAQRHQRVALRR